MEYVLLFDKKKGFLKNMSLTILVKSRKLCVQIVHPNQKSHKGVVQTAHTHLSDLLSLCIPMTHIVLCTGAVCIHKFNVCTRQTGFNE